MKKETIVILNWIGGIAAVILIGVCIQGFQAQADQSATPTTTTSPSYTPQPTAPVQTEAKPITTPTYKGYSCSLDCSGHEAGYAWGEEYEICDTDYSNGNSESFNEGVRSWAEENCDSSSDDFYEEDYDYSY